LDEAGVLMTRAKILNYIKTFILKNGYSPTYREISSQVGVALSGVAYHLNRLEADGCIEREPGVLRSIRVTSSLNTRLEAPSTIARAGHDE
jgi:SOS-response transcriptional repressor LexA